MIGSWRRLWWGLSASTATFRGKDRLIALVSRPGGTGVVGVSRSGVRWLLHGHDVNEFYLASRSEHSADLSEALQTEVQRRGLKVFWDIGANIGAISLPLLQRCPKVQAVMFEPSAEVAGRLMRNLAQNPGLQSRAMVMNVALAETTGLTPFFVSGETMNSGVGGLAASRNRSTVTVQVQSYSGDSLVQGALCPAPELIKIDVEGFEIEVLKGLRRTLVEQHPTIVFEHSVYRFVERQRPRDEVVRFLESIGYTVHLLNGRRKVVASDLDADADFIARA